MEKGKDYFDFGHNLLTIRRKKFPSQEALGEAVGVSGAQIGRYESNKDEPPHAMLWKLSRAFEIEIGDLFRDVDELKLTSVPKVNGAAGLQVELESVRRQLVDEKRVTESNLKVIRLLEQENKQLKRDLAAARGKQKAK